MVSSGWMNWDEDGGFCSLCFGCSTDQNAQEKKQDARLSSGWMNGDEDEGSVSCF